MRLGSRASAIATCGFAWAQRGIAVRLNRTCKSILMNKIWHVRRIREETKFLK